MKSGFDTVCVVNDRATSDKEMIGSSTVHETVPEPFNVTDPEINKILFTFILVDDVATDTSGALSGRMAKVIAALADREKSSTNNVISAVVLVPNSDEDPSKMGPRRVEEFKSIGH